MMKRALIILGCVFGTLVFGIIFLLIGMNLFGNYFVNATFLGGRGYEAGGNLGFLIGIVIGVVLSIFMYRRYGIQHNKDSE